MLKENSQIKIHMYNSQNEEININQNIYILKSKDGQLGFENEDKKEFTTLSSFDSRVEFEDLSNNNIYYYYTKLDIENPIIRINTAFKGCSSLEKISVLPRIYHN